MANDHYVPQFYLRGFEARPGKVWCYERQLRPSLMGIKSVASEDDYYAIRTVPGIEKDKVDKIFQQLESGAAPIIKYLKTASKIDLCWEDREVLSMFIASLSNRTPYQRESLTNLGLALTKETLKIFHENKELYHESARKAGLDADPELVEQSRLLKFDKDIELKYEPDSAADYFLGLSLELVEIVTEIIKQKHWSLLGSKTSRVFVTSDNPVVLMPPENHDNRLGVGVGNAIIAIPLSPQRSLLLANRKGPNDITYLSREAVKEINQWTILRAHKQVFASLESKDIRDAFNKTTHGHNTRVVVNDGRKKEQPETGVV